jgi:hypothetical protein
MDSLLVHGGYEINGHVMNIQQNQTQTFYNAWSYHFSLSLFVLFCTTLSSSLAFYAKIRASA